MEEEKILFKDNSGDKKHFILKYFTEQELQLFKNWLQENYSCITCRNRCLEKGWNEQEIELVYKIITEIL